MRRWWRTRWYSLRAGHGSDAGFSLVEVVVSLMLIALSMTAALSLFIRTMKATDVQDQRGQAVELGNDQLEYLRALAPGNLVAGRTQAVVDALWASPGGVNTSQDVEYWDSTATGSSTPTVPTVKTTVVDNVTFTIRSFVDKCYQAATGTCGTSNTGTRPTVMYRLIVSVAWTAGNTSGCSGGTCTYITSTLRDPSIDPSFTVS